MALVSLRVPDSFPTRCIVEGTLLEIQAHVPTTELGEGYAVTGEVLSWHHGAWHASSGGTATPEIVTIASNPTESPSELEVVLGAPSVGAFVSCSLRYRIVGDADWILWANGITTTTITVDGLDANEDYEFEPFNVLVAVDGVATTATATTGAAPTAFRVYDVEGGGSGNELHQVSEIAGWIGGSGDVVTTAYPLRNTTLEPQDCLSIEVESAAEVSGAYQFQVRPGGDYKNPAGDWLPAPFSDGATVRVTRINGIGVDSRRPGKKISLEVQFPTPIAPEAPITVWGVSKTENVNERCSANNGLWYSYWPIAYSGDVPNTSVGDGIANPGAMNFQLATPWALGISKIRWSRSVEAPAVLLRHVGDSTTEGFNGFGGAHSLRPTPNGYQGWVWQLNQLARAAGLRARFANDGIGGSETGDMFDRATMMISICAAEGSVLCVSPYSPNSPDLSNVSTVLARLAALKDACDAAGVKLLPFFPSLPGTLDAFAANPWLYPRGSDQKQAHTDTRAAVLSAYPYALILTESVKDGTDPSLPGTSHSDDCEHCNTQVPGAGVGQNAQAEEAFANITASMAGLGIDITPVP